MTNKKKMGYRLVIQAGLSEEQFNAAYRFAFKWKEEMDKTGYSWKQETGGGHKSALKRHGFGYLIKSTPEILRFRRVVSSRRVFGTVKESEVVRIKRGVRSDADSVCMCPRCTSTDKWGWANGKPWMYTVFEFGETKGR